MNALALSWTPSISSLHFLFISICFFDIFNKGFVEGEGGGGWGGGSWKAKKTNRGIGLSLSLFSHWEENCLIFQTANRVLISCLTAAKCFPALILVQNIKAFLYEKDIPVKNNLIFYVVFTKYYFPLFSLPGLLYKDS